MLIGLCAAAICFPICAFLWWASNVSVVPWLFEQVNLQGLFRCLASIYLPMFPCVFGEVCHRKDLWSNSTRRLIGGFLIGATLGIFESGRTAIFGEHPSLSHFHTESFSKILWSRPTPREHMGTCPNTFSKSWVAGNAYEFSRLLHMVRTWVWHYCCSDDSPLWHGHLLT